MLGVGDRDIASKKRFHTLLEFTRPFFRRHWGSNNNDSKIDDQDYSITIISLTLFLTQDLH